MSFWSRWFQPQPDPHLFHIETLKAENAFLRSMLENAQAKIIAMADPLLRQREVAVERLRLAPPNPPINNQRAHHPQLLRLQMEAREMRDRDEAARRDPAEVERAFRRKE